MNRAEHLRTCLEKIAYTEQRTPATWGPTGGVNFKLPADGAPKPTTSSAGRGGVGFGADVHQAAAARNAAVAESVRNPGKSDTAENQEARAKWDIMRAFLTKTYGAPLRLSYGDKAWNNMLQSAVAKQQAAGKYDLIQTLMSAGTSLAPEFMTGIQSWFGGKKEQQAE